MDIYLDVKPNSDLDLINHPLVAKWTMPLQIKYLSQFQSGQMAMLESLCRPWIPLNTSTNEYVEYSSHICKIWCWNRYQFWEYIMYMFLYFPYSNAQFPYILGSGFKGHKSHMLSSINFPHNETNSKCIYYIIQSWKNSSAHQWYCENYHRFGAWRCVVCSPVQIQSISSLTRNSSMNISFSMILIKFRTSIAWGWLPSIKDCWPRHSGCCIT